jgi:hypothetical protein
MVVLDDGTRTVRIGRYVSAGECAGLARQLRERLRS